MMREHTRTDCPYLRGGLGPRHHDILLTGRSSDLRLVTRFRRPSRSLRRSGSVPGPLADYSSGSVPDSHRLPFSPPRGLSARGACSINHVVSTLLPCVKHCCCSHYLCAGQRFGKQRPKGSSHRIGEEAFGLLGAPVSSQLRLDGKKTQDTVGSRSFRRRSIAMRSWKVILA